MILAKRIKKIREAKKLSQSDVADKCDMEPSSYGQIEREAENSSFKTLAKIAKAIGVSLKFLIDIDNDSYTE